MLLAKVIGNVWSTKKKDEISALRLLFIQRQCPGRRGRGRRGIWRAGDRHPGLPGHASIQQR
jgi:hypothetical protein